MQMNCITLDKLEESSMSVNSIYFLLLHLFLFTAILNQEGMQRDSIKQLGKQQINLRGHKALMGIFKEIFLSFKMQWWHLPQQPRD